MSSDGMSPFRPLAPSSRGHAGGSSRGEPDQHTPTAQPAESAQDASSLSDNGQSTGAGAENAFLHRSRKRRAPVHVSQNACTSCKKARSKCDGVEPAPCSRCLDRGVECQYEVHIKTAKEEMMRRIKDLEQLNRTDREKIAYLESFIRALAANDQGPEAITRLRQGQTLQQVADFLGDSRYSSITRLSPTSEKHLRAVIHQHPTMEQETMSSSSSLLRWSKVALPDAVKEHLLCLYITWIHPTHMLFSEKHFVSSLRSSGPSSSSAYCTPSMVNLMCAVGCTMFVDPNGTFGCDPNRCLSQFHSQALADLSKEDGKKPTWAISYALLYLLELSIGQARRAGSHLRAAVESLPNLDRTGFDDEAFEITSWGVHTLTTTWAGFTYVKPHNPTSTSAKVFQMVQPSSPHELWRFYRFPGDNQLSENQSNLELSGFTIQTARESARLNQVIHETMNIYCGSRGKVTGKSIVILYEKFVNWKESLPKEMRIRAGMPVVPHILYLHIHYCTALCQLLQPLVQSKLFSSASHELLRNTTIKIAKDGLDLLNSFAETYSHRYHRPMQLFCLVHLGDLLLQADGPVAESAIRFTLTALHEAREGLAIAGPLTAMFSQRVGERMSRLPEDLAQRISNSQQYGNEEKLDTCDRVTYVQPIEQLLGRLDASIAVQFEREWLIHIEAHGGRVSQGDGASADEMLLLSNSMEVSAGSSDGASETFSSRSSEAPPARRVIDVHSLINP